MDAGAETCETAADCDDGFECTTDNCGVGNVCRHTAIDALCTGEMERCFVGVGCRAMMAVMCSSDPECDDGSFCTGTETCVGPMGAGTCIPGRTMDCDDGNDCTMDVCNSEPAVDRCVYTPAPGCDAGVPPLDGGGTPCGAFEEMNYAGTYSFRPSAVSACMGSATYNITEARFSVSGGTLSVALDRFTLTQSPAPTDGTFDVSFSDGCASFRLEGEFACADRWAANWTASISGGCAFCSNQMSSVRGSRR
jgi:hypothetical protein